MKYSIIAGLLIASMATMVSATEPNVGGGGPTSAVNQSNGQMEMVPQCFPFAFMSNYLNGDILSIYENQNKCRAQRLIDFGI